jgi:hypothetical protein
MGSFADRYRPLLQLQRGLLLQYGWLKSWWRHRPVDAAGNPLPWLTYPAIDFISQFDFSDAAVFEWGSGFSTLWWADRCKQIVTVESNVEWISYIKPLLPAAVELIETAFDAEAEVAALARRQNRQFDVFVIDNNGRFRWRCAEAAAPNLAPGGFVILDNSDQCPKACAVLRDAGLTQIDFTGFAPANAYAHATSIFFRGSYRFKPRGAQPSRSCAQPNPTWPEC